jgi:hypothetical protein
VFLAEPQTSESDTMLKFRPVHLALFVLVSAYLATTGLGAAIIPTSFGQQQLAAFMYPESVPFSSLTTMGTPIYWFVLFSIILVVPPVALATEASFRRLAPESKSILIPTWIPVVLAGLISAFCLYKLAAAGGLTAHEVWDRSVYFETRMQRRTELFSLLNNHYYSFCYSSLPILGSFLLAKFVLNKDRLAGIAFVVVSVLLAWFDTATIMKAPLIIYIGTVALTLIACGVGVLRTFVMTAPIAVAVYCTLSILQFSNHETASWNVNMDAAPLTLQTSEDKTFSSSDDNTLSYKAFYMTRAAALRMAASFPYYIQKFSDPKEKCGLEIPPPLVFLPRQTCFPPIKIFNLMYPSIHYVQGYAPAASNVSAYAELGIGYSLIAMTLSGMIIGALSFFAHARNALSISITVATCIFSYYLTQVSLTGSILDSYGLLWMLLPLVLAIILTRVFGAKSIKLEAMRG